MQEAAGNKNGYVVKILVTILVIGLIAGVWMLKNGQAAPGKVQSAETEETGTQLAEERAEGYVPLHVTEEIDLEELKSYGLPIVIDFGADSCAPCKAMAPVLETLNEELAGEAIILFVDVWKYHSLALEFPVEVIPTQIFIDSDGMPYAPAEDEEIQFLQYSYRDTKEIAFTTHQGGVTEEQLRNVLEKMGVRND